MKIINFFALFLAIILLDFKVYALSSDEAKIRAENDRKIVSEALSKINEIPSIPENWKEIVEDGIRRILKDPESARFRYPDEKQKYCALSNVIAGNPFKPISLIPISPLVGYSGIVFVNAKNSYGGYTGEEPFWYMITDGKLSLIQNVKAENDGVLSSFFKPVNNIHDIELSPLRWEGNYFMCK